MLRVHLLLSFVLLLPACPSSTTTDPGEEGGACLDDGTCNAGLACRSDLCVVDDDADGNIGTEGEACFANNTCFSGLTCVDDVCVDNTDNVGREGEACFANDTCFAGLECVDDTCIAVVAEDSGVVVADSGVVVEDSGTVVEDSGVVVEDSGIDVEDSGVVVEDSGVVVEDAGPNADDAGTHEDAGSEVVDGGGLDDAGGGFDDAGGGSDADAGHVDDDAGVAADAGMVDAGEGVAVDDCGVDEFFNGGVCLPVTTCAPGQVMLSESTATQDRYCKFCEPGTYCAGGDAPEEECVFLDHDNDPSTPCRTAVSAHVRQGTLSYCFIDNEDDVHCWGVESDDASQAHPPKRIADVQKLAVGQHHACALSISGHVTCWGERAAARVPDVLQVAGGVVDLAAGDGFTCAVLDDGNTRCWGDHRIPFNTYDALTVVAGAHHVCVLNAMNEVSCFGQGVDAFLSPPLLDNVVKLAGGDTHSCALDAYGKVTCWGAGTYGQHVSPPDDVYVDLDAGQHHTCAINDGGTLLCWGRDVEGQLQVPPVGAPWQDIFVGARHTCATDAGGAVRCWGDDAFGQLQPPADVSVLGVAAGGDVACVVDDALLPRCWGSGLDGVNKPPVYDYVVHAVAMGETSCLLDVNGTVLCWGGGEPAMPDDLGVVVQLAADTQTICALTDTNNVRCWGEHTPGALPPVRELTGGTCAILVDGSIECWGNRQGSNVPAGLPPAQDVAVGLFGNWACSLDDDGRPTCWGSGAPTPVSDGPFVELSAGPNNALCTRVSDGSVACDEDISQRATTPMPIVSGASAIDGNPNFMCSLVGGDALCWGLLHLPWTSDASHGLTTLSVSDNHACGATSTGDAHCWGVGAERLGARVRPPMELHGVADVDFSLDEACALTTDNEVHCEGGWTGSGHGGATLPTQNVTHMAHFVTETTLVKTPEGVHSCSYTECQLQLVGSNTVLGADGAHGDVDAQHIPFFIGPVPPFDNVVGTLYSPCAVLDGHVTCSDVADWKHNATDVAEDLGRSSSCLLHRDGSVSCDPARPSPVPQLFGGVRHADDDMFGGLFCAAMDDGAGRCWAWGEELPVGPR